MVQLKESVTGEYGLHQWETKGWQLFPLLPLDKRLSQLISEPRNQVILIGEKASDNTIAPPADAASLRDGYEILNTRYFSFRLG